VTLLERDAELAALERAMANAAGGAGRLVVIAGPAGIGKSGLLADLRAESGTELAVLPARAGELEREFGFGVVRQLFEAAVAEKPDVALAGAAGPAARVLGAPGGRRRRVVRRPPRPLLAHRQPRGGAAAAARRRRPALVRPPVAALPRLPRPAPRGAARPARGHRPLG
jgi:hypothetical protein